MWLQETIQLRPKGRGFHLITPEILQQLPGLSRVRRGLCHFFLQHTSASLAINENADPDVRSDLESFVNRLAPEDAPYFLHTTEGPDDMPAHIKAVLIGGELTLPVTDGRLNLGTWQGVYLCEHRDRGGSRRIIATIQGEGDA
ncbi:MAG: secondary thiamine-phosphate synthase enzyme YjbQ [bacterium]|nr:secondary thiamine-phosphate synthase enzyme YjbQ [bacterium]